MNRLKDCPQLPAYHLFQQDQDEERCCYCLEYNIMALIKIKTILAMPGNFGTRYFFVPAKLSIAADNPRSIKESFIGLSVSMSPVFTVALPLKCTIIESCSA